MGIVGAIYRDLQGERAEGFDQLLEILHCVETERAANTPIHLSNYQLEKHSILCTPIVEFFSGGKIDD